MKLSDKACKNAKASNTQLPDVTAMWNELKELKDRHLVMEAHLIIEEYLEALLEKLIPNIGSKLFKDPASGGLTYEQKRQVLECFLKEESFLTFPKMVQGMRNKIVHKRDYVIDENGFKEFFKNLSSGDKGMVLTCYNNAAQKIGSAIEFHKIAPKEQFLLLLIWFTIGLKVEIDRILPCTYCGEVTD